MTSWLDMAKAAKQVAETQATENEVIVESPGDDAAKIVQVKQETALSFSKDKTLVLDTGALLHGDLKLEQLGSEFYTTPQVLSEIRDSKSRHILNTLPFKIHVREPIPDSFKVISKYSKKTGDYGFLSHTDSSILALTYELELARNGPINIKPEPKGLDIVGHRKVKVVTYDWLFGPSGPMSKHGNTEMSNAKHQNEEPEEVVKEEDGDGDGEWITVGKKPAVKPEEEEEAVIDDSVDDDESGWITPENIKNVKSQVADDWETPTKDKPTENTKTTTNTTIAQQQQPETKDKPMVISTEAIAISSNSKVGCVSQDYAIQNVLLHMGLNLVTGDGKRLKFLKRWVKRCESCSTYVLTSNLLLAWNQIQPRYFVPIVVASPCARSRVLLTTRAMNTFALMAIRSFLFEAPLYVAPFL